MLAQLAAVLQWHRVWSAVSTKGRKNNSLCLLLLVNSFHPLPLAASFLAPTSKNSLGLTCTFVSKKVAEAAWDWSTICTSPVPARKWVNPLWLCSCKTYYIDASLLWALLLCIKCDSCIDCAPKSKGPQLCQKLCYSISSPLTGNTGCLRENSHFTIIPGLAMWEFSCLKGHGFGFLPFSRTSPLLGWCYTVSSWRDEPTPGKLFPPQINQEELWRQYQVLLLSSMQAKE